MSNEFIEQFSSFLEKDLEPATKELEKITKDSSRKHIQRLVYTNLVDRFDTFVDKALLACIETEKLLNELLETHKQQPINKSDMFRLIISSEPKKIVMDQLEETLRGSILRGRHSDKLFKLLDSLGLKENDCKRSRVNSGTGKILNKYTSQNKKIPASIIGYADWLYSKRNAIVHGGGNTKFLDNDIKQLKQRFNCTPASIKLKPGSIKTAAYFYKEIVEIVNVTTAATESKLTV